MNSFGSPQGSYKYQSEGTLGGGYTYAPQMIFFVANIKHSQTFGPASTVRQLCACVLNEECRDRCDLQPLNKPLLMKDCQKRAYGLALSSKRMLFIGGSSYIQLESI